MRYSYDNRGGNRSSNFNDRRELDEQRDMANMYSSNSKKIKTVTLDQIENLVTLEELREETKEKLKKENVTELFPVQQAAYSLFMKGHELIVKLVYIDW